MTPAGALIELLARVGAADAVFVTAHELNQWPSDAVAAMKSQKLINKAAPALTAICPGCEQECTMPIEAAPASSRVPAFFVVCDKRDDTNRVMISPDHLTQWRATTGGVAKFVAQDLSLRWQGTMTSAGDALQIGIVKGRGKSQMLCLRSDSELILVAGSGSLPLADIFTFAAGQYALDAQAVERMVNASTTTDARYTPSNARREARKLVTKERNESWGKAFRKLAKKHPDKSANWCAKQIEKMDIGDGKNSETIRKNMQ
jgi:hypothetical protein